MIEENLALPFVTQVLGQEVLGSEFDGASSSAPETCYGEDSPAT